MRFALFDRWGTQLRTLSGVSSATWADELNGEDTVELVTTDAVTKGDRVVWCDGHGVWHEHVASSVEQSHEGGPVSYRCTFENSVSELFGDFVEDKKPRDATAKQALEGILETSRWTAGTVSVSGTNSTNFYRTSAREALASLIELWGGELSTTIGISGARVTSRKVNLTRRGSDNGLRFTYGRNMSGVKRTFCADDVVTALYGFGKGEETEDGVGRGIDFSSVNGGKMYVEDADALELWGRPDGKGGKAHVFGKVEFSDCEDPNELKRLTKGKLDEMKEPKVSYEASVELLAGYGYDFADAAVGDDVAIVDTDFEVEVRVKGRVTRIKRDLLDDGRAMEVTVGNIVEGIDAMMGDQYAELKSLGDRSTAWDVAAYTPGPYIQQLMNGLNAQFDAGMSYVYQSPQQGIVIGSVPLDQETGLPTRTPASAIQLKGGGLRIANSLKGDGSWDWRTFGTGDGFVADMIVAGVLRNAAGTMVIDLENNTVRMPFAAADQTGVTVGDLTSDELGPNAHMSSDGIFEVRIGEEVLASFGQSLIELGKNSLNAVIEMCDGAGSITTQDGLAYISGTNGVQIGLGLNYLRSLNDENQVSFKKLHLIARDNAGLDPTVELTIDGLGDQASCTASELLSLFKALAGRSFVPLYRLSNPYDGNAKVLTCSRTERQNLISAGWDDEGVSCYVIGSSD